MPAVPRGPYKNGIKRRREILESAARVFALHGYAGGSLREIANEVGVTPAALIRHFESKESLLVAVLEYWAKEGDTEVPMGDDGLGYFTRFPHLMEYHTKNRGLIALFLVQTILQAAPNGLLARLIQPYLHSGMYLDDWFTRVTFRLWPPGLR